MRLTRSAFRKLRALVEQFLLKDEVMAKRSSGGAITGETRLAVTLRLLSGASYLDCALSYGIEWSTIWRVFHETVAVLNRVLKVKTGYKER